MNKAIIYTTKGCPYCIKAKKLLKMLSIEFDEFDVTDSFEQMQKMLDTKYLKENISTVPQIILNDKYVGGFDDLENLYKTSELNRYLI